MWTLFSTVSKLQESYNERLQGIEDITLPPELPEVTEGFTHYTIRTTRRAELRDHLARKDIKTDVYYPRSIHLQEAFSFLNHRWGDFPESEKAQEEVLSLPFDIYTTNENRSVFVCASNTARV